MLPVAFEHDTESVKKNIKMRKIAMDHLSSGGLVVLFPAGAVASAPSWLAPAREPDWNPFTAKMLLKSEAKVVPVYFSGENSRWYQWAALLSPTLRQSLLLHEIAHSMGKPQKPVVGNVLERGEIEIWADDPTGFMRWLRAKTLSLADEVD